MQGFGKIVEVRSPSWPRGGAADPHSCVPLARLTVQKVAEPLQKRKKRGGGGGLFLNALVWDQMLPVRAVEGADSSFCRGIQRWLEPSAQLLSSPAVAASAAGLSCRIFFLWQNELDFFCTSSSANMYSAALLLMLAVRIHADSMEGPTGKRRNEKKERNVCLFGFGERAPVNLLTRREGEGRWFKVDYQGLKSLFLHSLDIHGEVKIALSSFGGFKTLKKKKERRKSSLRWCVRLFKPDPAPLSGANFLLCVRGGALIFLEAWNVELPSSSERHRVITRLTGTGDYSIF